MGKGSVHDSFQATDTVVQTLLSNVVSRDGTSRSDVESVIHLAINLLLKSWIGNPISYKHDYVTIFDDALSLESRR